MVKLIATDMDNTLLDSNGRITNEVMSVILKLKNMGIIISLVTGRTYQSAKGIAKLIESDVPVICYNGAMIKTTETEKVIFYEPLKRDVVSEILSYAYQNNIYVQLYNNDTIIVDRLDLSKHNDPDLEYAPVKELGDLRFYNIDSPKVLFAMNPSDVSKVQCELDKLFGEECYFAQSEDHLIEIMSKGINKGRALNKLSDILKIQKNEILGIGDNTNDIPLLHSSGIAVSVGNGVQKLKNIADYVTIGEREKGFVEAINKFVFEK